MSATKASYLSLEPHLSTDLLLVRVLKYVVIAWNLEALS